VPTSQWQPGHYVLWQHPFPLPADLPAGRYWLALGLYDPQSGARLPVRGDQPVAAPPYAADALLIGPLEVGTTE
jgi:hypothetical protein